MKTTRHWLAACSVGLALVAPVHLPADAGLHADRVIVKAGVLEGIRPEKTPNEEAFLGIPYAAPPVGELRWKPPRPATAWAGVRQARAYGPACPQLPAPWLPDIGWKEDCLYLNVWTLPHAEPASLPVLVYFHGGSNTAGYSQANPLGPALAGTGVVFVGANYRLGPMGFLAHPALSAESPRHSSGNYGLLDQLMALAWVHDNIARFGGDPDQVTVMGQSAGAVDTCLLMASPLAKGLFRRAILESGDCEGTLIAATGEEAGELLAKDLKVSSGPGLLRNLRALSAEQILRSWSGDRRVHFEAIVDGWVIPEQPAKVFAEGRQMKIPVLVGSNATEATVFGDAGPKSRQEFAQYLAADSGEYAEEESRLYPTAADADVPGMYLQFQDDQFAYGAYSMASATRGIGQPAYLYEFTFAETGKRAALGAYHGEELLFLSDAFPSDWQHTQADKSLGENLRRYWTEFVKTGNPNGPHSPHWPAFTQSTDRYLELGRAIKARTVSARIHGLAQIMRKVVHSTGSVEARVNRHFESGGRQQL
jgi:para-nitrobenzyl esterase